jgi:23S rRNA pseudouridine1911/1915/1917 synthase
VPNTKREIFIDTLEQGAGGRIDRALVRALPDLTRNRARRLIADGRVFIDGKRCRIASRVVNRGARIVVHFAERHTPDEALRILYEDERLIAIDKRPGEVVNETETSAELSVVERLRDLDAYTVHRIDRDTSGVVVLAKGRKVAQDLSLAFSDRRTKKTYIAFVRGHIEDRVLSEPIGVDKARPRARWVDPRGKPAETRIHTLSRATEVSAVEAQPITGRTHQIRVHLAHAGVPIVGDVLYGGPLKVRVNDLEIEAARVMLHARSLRIDDAGRTVEVEAPIPDDMQVFVEAGLVLAPGVGVASSP